MRKFLQRWILGLGALVLGAGWAPGQADDAEVVLLPQPTPGSLPDLRPPPGVEITRDAFENLMRKPFTDDLETPPWEREKVVPGPLEPGTGERVFQPEVVGEPDRVPAPETEPVVPEVIRVPDRVVDGVILPPLRPPSDSTEAIPELTGVVFETNPYEARAKAMEEGKFMLLAFIGTEWNGASRQLSWEVFNSPDFLEFAGENAVPCYLDFPQKENSGDGVLMRFKRHYGIGGLPVVVIFDSDGTPYVKKSGYLPGSQEAYLAELKVLVEERKKVVKERRMRLELDGFREWRNLEGKVFFGKLKGVRDGQVWFVDPEGESAKVDLEKLSEEDRAHAAGAGG